MAETDVTRILEDLGEGDENAFNLLLSAVYPELRQMASARMRDQRNGHTLNPTGLVHEAYLRLVRYQDVRFEGRSHFFGAAAQTMRRVLIDHARAKSAEKRRGERVTIVMDDNEPLTGSGLDVLEVDDALRRLAADRPHWVRVVECRYFAGLSIEETAEALGVSHGTVSNHWRLARAWLQRELAG